MPQDARVAPHCSRAGLLNIKGVGMTQAVRSKYMAKPAGKHGPPNAGKTRANEHAKRTRGVMIGHFMRRLEAPDVGGLGLRRVCDELPHHLLEAPAFEELKKVSSGPSVVVEERGTRCLAPELVRVACGMWQCNNMHTQHAQAWTLPT